MHCALEILKPLVLFMGNHSHVFFVDSANRHNYWTDRPKMLHSDVIGHVLAIVVVMIWHRHSKIYNKRYFDNYLLLN